MNAKTGKVYLVGAGPGDPGLITVRGVECIQRADVVVYDYLANTVFLRYARRDAEIVYVGKKDGCQTMSQDAINALLLKHSKAGKVVTRLKGGDPCVLGRGGEEGEALTNAGIAFEIVPGISSAIAVPAYAGIPVTQRGVATAFMVITGHEDPTKPEAQVDWKNVAEFFGTRVILMGVKRMRVIAEELMKHGLAGDTPVAMVRKGTTGEQRTIAGTLATIADVAERENFTAPAVTIIGEAARSREKLNWFEARPLFGKRIVVTRSREQASELVRQLTELGADVLEIPTITIKPAKDLKPLREAIKSIGVYDWVVFTSPNAVKAFFEEFFKGRNDIRDLGMVKIAVVGAATQQKVEELHVAVDLAPEEFTGDALLAEFKKSVSCENVKFLLPRGDLADERLARGLEDAGGIVDDLEAYQTAPESEDQNGHRARLLAEGADVVTFASSSAVNNFCKLVDVPALQKKFPQLRFASIGPETTKAVQANGMTVAAEAKVHTIPGLVDAILPL